MKLILTREVAGLGLAGDIVEVADGYGRNFLVPARRRDPVDARAPRSRSCRSSGRVTPARSATCRTPARSRPTSRSCRSSLEARAGKDGRLFGSVTTADIAVGGQDGRRPAAGQEAHPAARSHQDDRRAHRHRRPAPGRRGVRAGHRHRRSDPPAPSHQPLVGTAARRSGPYRRQPTVRPCVLGRATGDTPGCCILDRQESCRPQAVDDAVAASADPRRHAAAESTASSTSLSTTMRRFAQVSPHVAHMPGLACRGYRP